MKLTLHIIMIGYSLIWGIVLPLFRFLPKNSTLGIWYRLHKSKEYPPNIPKNKSHILFACSSVGEYRRIETLASHYTSQGYYIEISFFSASGYNTLEGQRHKWPLVSMLPFDRKKDVNYFLESRHLHYVFISSNMIWPNLMLGLDRRNIPYSVVGCSYYRPSLWQSLCLRIRMSFIMKADYLFCIDHDTAGILSDYFRREQLIVTGDPRLSSILNLESHKSDLDIDLITRFKGGQRLFILGSAYEEELALTINAYETLKEEGYKVIIAPHHLDHIPRMATALKSADISYGLYTEGSQDCKILILDTMGMLQYTYAHADIAFIGGGWQKGIHNIVEAIRYNCTVVTGPKIEKFPEARYFKNREVLFTISNSSEMKDVLEREKSQTFQSKKRSAYSDWITNNKDANQKIIQILNLVDATM